MRRLRKDLDGLRVSYPGGKEVWFIMNGMRHYIFGPKVYDELFLDMDVHEDENVQSIMRGPDLNEGTCLVQAEDDEIYLVFGEEMNVRKYKIDSWETFVSCKFKLNSVRKVPRLVVTAIISGTDIDLVRNEVLENHSI